jgi:DNA-binding SARP family transcriptional activator
LRKTIWQLRSALNSQTVSLSDHVLVVEPDWIQLNPEAALWLDAAVFEQAFLRLQHLPGAELSAQGVQVLEDAVNLYRGGLQESWYQDWYLQERERFQHMYLIMLDKLMDHCESHHRYTAGLTYGTRILLCERARERTHRRLMRLHYLSGDRTAALRQYERCIRVLDEELGVGPARRTIALYDQIRTDQFAGLTLKPLAAEKSPLTASYPLPHVLHSLSRLLAVLDQVQQEIHREMQALELTTDDQG